MALLLFISTSLLLLISPLAQGKQHDNYNAQYEYSPLKNHIFPERFWKHDRQGPVFVPLDRTKGTSTADHRPAPPPHDQVAKLARYIVHYSDWAAVATLSSAAAIRGSPFANVWSISDGPLDNSSGVPYMYITHFDPSSEDLQKDSRSSLLISLAETDYCNQTKVDPEDPRCARVVLTGRITKVQPKSSEMNFAQNAIFTRHPAMRTWPKSHHFHFVKMEIQQILILEYFGGPKIVPTSEYFNPPHLHFKSHVPI